MKRRAILLALIAAILVTSTVLAAPSALNVSRNVLSGGGGRVVAGGYALDGTIGQSVAGVVTAGSNQVCSGFWCGLGLYKILLPLIMR